MNLYRGDLRELVVSDLSDLNQDRPFFTWCPYHDDETTPNLAVYPDHAYCYACRQYVSRHDFSARFSAMELFQTRQWAHDRERRAPKTRQSVNPHQLAKDAYMLLLSKPEKLAYLEGRGISLRTVKEYHLGHYGAGYALPVFDREGIIQTLRFRRDDAVPSEMGKYWGLRGFNGTLLYPTNEPVPPEVIFLTEGEFDALLLRQSGLEAFTFTNGAQAMPDDKTLLLLLSPATHIVLVRDQDLAGQLGTLRLLEKLTELGLPANSFSWNSQLGKDVTEVYQRDAYAFEALIERLRECLPEETRSALCS